MAQHDGYKKQHVAGRDSDGKFRILEHAKRDFAGCLVFRVSYLEKVDNQAFFKKKRKIQTHSGLALLFLSLS